MKITQIKENRRKMILQFSVPSIIAMLLQTVITITDGYFTGNYVGDDALAAINLGLPILYFYLAIGLCIGVGGSVISGRLLGGREKQKASEVFTQTMITTVLICAVISLVLFCFFAPIQGILKADGALTNYFAEYPLLEKYPDIMTQYFEGGEYAVYHFKGYPKFMFMVYQNIFCRWLSKTGNQLDDRSILDIYRKVEENGYMEVDICFPLKI